MATFFRLPKCDAGADFVRTRQTFVWHKGVIVCVHDKRRHLNAYEVRLGRGPGPVVIGVFKAMQRCSDHIVKVVEIARVQQVLPAEQLGVCVQFLQCLGHHAV